MTTKSKPYSKPRPLNSRQRQFCINCASGMTQSEAYIKAGYSVDPNIGSASDCASRLMQSNASVQDYYTSLLERQESLALAENIKNTIATPTERKEILTEMLRARLLDFMDADGQPKMDKDTPNNRAAKEYYHRQKFDKFGNPTITKNIKLVDPIAAIQELNKMDGSYAPTKHQVAKAVQINVSVVDKSKRANQGAVTLGSGGEDNLLLEGGE